MFHFLKGANACDIWSENGIAIFPVMVHFIDLELKLNTRLAICKVLDKITHIGNNIADLTYKDSLTRGWVQTWKQSMKISTFVLRMRAATCLKLGAKSRVQVVCATANRNASEQPFPFQEFYRSSRKSIGICAFPSFRQGFFPY